ncbi:MAG: SUMF1/EgtB/PvdO family nonheme iron enzyme [Methanosarcina thermophila]|jgi:hypothetical protein|uniref:Metal binding domain of Ada n=1 Tax=Methanosarcina thermophila TaxID=2210 RepID=A0A1I7ADK9_METTE|nr:SUMF1/EgtB/PvdO family nonheme iron enzyme [Methanosarcina thermophila]GLI14227.1 hypothetical protein MTHERMMSTA1_13530 [Methanosarcina thermophila MST-A1]SFT73031.1 Metal binding domain of Ada [Methanosarcina thermophila]
MNNSVDNSIKNPSSGLTSNSIGMEFVLIPAGEFDMGSPMHEKRRKLWESPVHRVTIKKPFYLSKYPVTQEQWQVVMGDNPSYFRGEKHPVENVSWNEVQVFFSKLNALENARENNPTPEQTSTPEVTSTPKPVQTPVPTYPTSDYAGKYIGNSDSKIFHYADCSSAERISPENRVIFNSREEAIAAGYRPCKRCNP